MEKDESPVVHIEVNYELHEQRDETSEDCIYVIDTFTIWTEDRAYVSDPLMESVYSAPRNPPEKKSKEKAPVNYEHDSEPIVIKN